MLPYALDNVTRIAAIEPKYSDPTTAVREDGAESFNDYLQRARAPAVSEDAAADRPDGPKPRSDRGDSSQERAANSTPPEKDASTSVSEQTNGKDTASGTPRQSEGDPERRPTDASESKVEDSERRKAEKGDVAVVVEIAGVPVTVQSATPDTPPPQSDPKAVSDQGVKVRKHEAGTAAGKHAVLPQEVKATTAPAVEPGSAATATVTAGMPEANQTGAGG